MPLPQHLLIFRKPKPVKCSLVPPMVHEAAELLTLLRPQDLATVTTWLRRRVAARPQRKRG